MVILLDRPGYRLDILTSPPAEQRRVRRSRLLPSCLLDPHREVVPYRHRPDEVRWLSAWRDSPHDPVSVLLVTGPDGHGKTRLAGHFGAQSQLRGWAVAQGVESTLRLWTGAVGQHELDQGQPLLVTVDNAERWRLPVLAQLVENLSLDYPERRIRVLLLARPCPSLWPTLTAELAHGGAMLAEPVELGELVEPAGRAQAFHEAVAAFAVRFALPQARCGDLAPPRDLAAADYGSPLTLHMAALAAVCAATQDRSVPERQDLSGFLLDHEWHHWEVAALEDDGPSPEMMAQVVFLATLFGPLTDLPAGQTLLRRAGAADGQAEAARLVIAHERLYPSEPAPSSGATGDGRVTHKQTLVPLRPDRFGADFVGHHLTRSPPAARLLGRLLTEGAETLAVRRCLTVLATAARRCPAAATTLFTLLGNQPQLSAQLTADVLQLVVEHAPEEVAEAVQEALPRSGTELLRPAYHLAQRLYTALPPDAAESRRAARLAFLGHRLTALGDRSGALVPTREAVDLYRRLAEADPDTYLPDLAMALSNLGARLVEVGDPSGALSAAWQAVDLYRRLAEADPETYLPDLAMALSNLGGRLVEVGDTSGALASSQEVVQIRRRLAEVEPDAHLPDLATVLSSFGGRLVEVGDKSGALAFSREVVQIRRRLAEVEPDAYLPHLAMALSNLGTRLPPAGDKSGALVPTREAVDLYRRLAEVGPVAYLPGLAMALSNLGARLAAVGERSGALVPTREAVDLYRRLAEVDPDAYLPGLAMALSNLGVGLAAVGERGGALVPTREAVEINRRLAEADPAAYLPYLAHSLWARAWIGADGPDRLAEALTAVNEAIGIYGSLAEHMPTVFAGYLLAALRTRVGVLDRLGRGEEADALRRILDHMMVNQEPDPYLDA